MSVIDGAQGFGDGLFPGLGQWRLAQVELANWGTFQGLHRVPIAREGFLLTGASGSGKSSLLDAVAAVLVPRGKVRFNAAAAETGGRLDRDVLSYVRGAWRRRENPETGEIASEYLRKGTTWSGVNLLFEDGAGGAPLSLVKLYHVAQSGSRPADVSELSLLLTEAVSLAELRPFAENGIDPARIKRRWPGVFLTKKVGAFGERFARHFGIPGAESLDLWHKTQSAKSLGSLDSLFRDFMLEVPESFDIAGKAAEQFSELKRAHDTVVDARDQVTALGPLRALGRDHRIALEDQGRLTALEDALTPYAAQEKARLAREDLDAALRQTDTARAEEAAAALAQKTAQEAYDVAHSVVLGYGEAALTRLEGQAEGRKRELEVVRNMRAALLRDLSDAGVPEAPQTLAEFEDLRRLVAKDLAGTDAAVLREELQASAGKAIELKKEMSQVKVELEAAVKSKSNLDAALTGARRKVAQAAGLSADQLPFAGELLQVKEEHAEWTGAIERVLRPLNRMMLVPAAHREAVTKAANDHHLGTRLVMEFVGAGMHEVPGPRTRQPLPAMVEVRPGPFASWLQATLHRDYDYECAQDLGEFHAATRAVTMEGQVKRGKNRQEKDDRRRVGDRSQWIMGFDSQAKQDRLFGRLGELRQELEAADQSYDQLQGLSERRRLRERLCRDLGELEWREVDEDSAKGALEQARGELAAYRAQNPDLREAEAKERAALDQRDAATKAWGAAEGRVVGLEERAARAREAIARADAEAAGASVPGELLSDLDRRFEAARQHRSRSFQTVADTKDKVRQELGKEKSQAQGRISGAEREIIRLEEAYRGRWPGEAGDLAAAVEDLPGFLERLDRLERDGLPEFEEKFFGLLSKQSTQNIGQLADYIRRAPGRVRDRIRVINGALAESRFDVGRHLKIEVKDCATASAKDFLAELKTIASGAFDQSREREDRDAAEARFESINSLMTRLRSDQPTDRRWRDQVLDTRKHVRFIGKEIDAAGETVAVHDSTAGLSGGQQQKLAFFCLAAALKFRLTEDITSQPRFGTVIMDEAFDRADAEFTRMALDVFRQFGFHMVLATPLKAIQVMEDYIRGVGHVHCVDGKESRVDVVEYGPAGTRLAAGELAGEFGAPRAGVEAGGAGSLEEAGHGQG